MKHGTALSVAAILMWAAGCASSPSSAPQHHPERTHHHAHDVTAPSTTEQVLMTPSAIQAEHAHLHEQLDAALAVGGQTAVRAQAVADVLGPHFEEEEAYAMPPLGLLEPMAKGERLSDAQVRTAIQMADRLRAEYSQMIEEHRQLEAALEALASAARAEGQAEALAFAETLMMHAHNEEQVLYPTTLLIGEYLKLQQQVRHTPGTSPEAPR